MTTKLMDVRGMTASDAYECRLQEVKSLLAAAEVNLRARDQTARRVGIDWGYVGDMTRLAETLSELLS